jgi:hypothetical protein
VGRAAEGEEADRADEAGLQDRHLHLMYSAPTAVLLTFGGIFAREAFHAPYWLITLTLKRQTSPFRAG